MMSKPVRKPSRKQSGKASPARNLMVSPGRKPLAKSPARKPSAKSPTRKPSAKSPTNKPVSRMQSENNVKAKISPTSRSKSKGKSLSIGKKEQAKFDKKEEVKKEINKKVRMKTQKGEIRKKEKKETKEEEKLKVKEVSLKTRLENLRAMKPSQNNLDDEEKVKVKEELRVRIEALKALRRNKKHFDEDNILNFDKYKLKDLAKLKEDLKQSENSEKQKNSAAVNQKQPKIEEKKDNNPFHEDKRKLEAIVLSEIEDSKPKEDYNKFYNPQFKSTNDIFGSKAPNKIGMAKAQNEIGMPKVQNEIGMPKAQNEFGMAKAQNEFGIAKVQNEVGMSKAQNDVGMSNLQNDIGITNLQNEIVDVKSFDSVGSMIHLFDNDQMENDARISINKRNNIGINANQNTDDLNYIEKRLGELRKNKNYNANTNANVNNIYSSGYNKNFGQFSDENEKEKENIRFENMQFFEYKNPLPERKKKFDYISAVESLNSVKPFGNPLKSSGQVISLNELRSQLIQEGLCSAKDSREATYFRGLNQKNDNMSKFTRAVQNTNYYKSDKENPLGSLRYRLQENKSDRFFTEATPYTSPKNSNFISLKSNRYEHSPKPKPLSFESSNKLYEPRFSFNFEPGKNYPEKGSNFSGRLFTNGEKIHDSSLRISLADFSSKPQTTEYLPKVKMDLKELRSKYEFKPINSPMQKPKHETFWIKC